MYTVTNPLGVLYIYYYMTHLTYAAQPRLQYLLGDRDNVS